MRAQSKRQQLPVFKAIERTIGNSEKLQNVPWLLVAYLVCLRCTAKGFLPKAFKMISMPALKINANVICQDTKFGVFVYEKFN